MSRIPPEQIDRAAAFAEQTREISEAIDKAMDLARKSIEAVEFLRGFLKLVSEAPEASVTRRELAEVIGAFATIESAQDARNALNLNAVKLSYSEADILHERIDAVENALSDDGDEFDLSPSVD